LRFPRRITRRAPPPTFGYRTRIITDGGGLLPNESATIDALIKQGVHFAVCDQSTHGYASGFARTTDGRPDAVYKELTSNLIGNSLMVPSGIVAVGHAQERGYAYAYCG